MNSPRKMHLRSLLNTITDAETSAEIEPSIGSLHVVHETLQRLKLLDKESTNECISQLDETLMEMKIFNVASKVILACVNSIDYDPQPTDINMEKMKKYLCGAHPASARKTLKMIEEDLEIDPFLPKFEALSSLSGALNNADVPEPQKKPRREVVRQKEPLAKKAVAENAVVTNDETDGILTFYLRVLTDEYKKQGKKPVNYLDFVIDTQDFSRTVENIFYTSFLLNDGRFRLIGQRVDGEEEEEEEEVLQLLPVDAKEQLLRSKNPDLEKTQSVVSFNMDDWAKHCKYIKRGILENARNKCN